MARSGRRPGLQPGPGIAGIWRGELALLLNRPGGGGSAAQSMPDGSVPARGGWNRIQVEVADIDATYAQLKATGAHFRSEVITGNGGKQVLVEDPSGNR